jgi:hypothetical protein
MSGLNTDIHFLSPWLAKQKKPGSVSIAEADTEAHTDVQLSWLFTINR